jgi:hypothetical protein
MGVPNIGIDSKGSALGDVRFGSSEADISVSLANVRFTPESGHQAFMSARPGLFFFLAGGLVGGTPFLT